MIRVLTVGLVSAMLLLVQFPCPVQVPQKRDNWNRHPDLRSAGTGMPRDRPQTRRRLCDDFDSKDGLTGALCAMLSNVVYLNTRSS